MDFSRLKDDWTRRGFSCDLWVDPAGQVWKNYVHETDELIVLAEGLMEIEFGGKVIRPEIGEEVLIPAGRSHTVRNTGDTASRWYYGYKNNR
jgi:mannose-6-phosphate isomerase-like protein (cupin superfamily)